MKYICEWGVRHGRMDVINDRKELTKEFIDCKCYDTYGSHYRMVEWLKNKGYEIKYLEDITDQMREDYLCFNPQRKRTIEPGDYKVRKAKRLQWTNDLLTKINPEELAEFKKKAEELLAGARARGLVSKAFLKEYTMILIRNHYGCPY